MKKPYLQISFNRIDKNALIEKIKYSKLNNKCSKDIPYSLDTVDEFFEVVTFKNTNNYDIYLIATIDCQLLLGSYFFNSDYNFNGHNDSYLIESKRNIPKIIKLSKGEEFFTYFESERTNILHSIQKLKYFNSKDSTFNDVWFKYPNMDFIGSPIDYISENRLHFSDERYNEIYRSFIVNDSIDINSQTRIDSETKLLNKIRLM